MRQRNSPDVPVCVPGFNASRVGSEAIRLCAVSSSGRRRSTERMDLTVLPTTAPMAPSTTASTAIGPSSRPGLEIVRFQEVADASGPALVRSRAAFVPMDANAQVRLVDPVVLIRSPYRVMFAYAGADDTWQPTWRNAAELPKRVRITVRDGVTQQRLAVSTAALVHVDTPAACVREKNVNQCLAQIAQGTPAAGNPTPAAAATPR